MKTVKFFVANFMFKRLFQVTSLISWKIMFLKECIFMVEEKASLIGGYGQLTCHLLP
jgi:hypothetical protein